MSNFNSGRFAKQLQSQRSALLLKVEQAQEELRTLDELIERFNAAAPVLGLDTLTVEVTETVTPAKATPVARRGRKVLSRQPHGTNPDGTLRHPVLGRIVEILRAHGKAMALEEINQTLKQYPEAKVINQKRYRAYVQDLLWKASFRHRCPVIRRISTTGGERYELWEWHPNSPQGKSAIARLRVAVKQPSTVEPEAGLAEIPESSAPVEAPEVEDLQFGPMPELRPDMNRQQLWAALSPNMRAALAVLQSQLGTNLVGPEIYLQDADLARRAHEGLIRGVG